MRQSPRHMPALLQPSPLVMVSVCLPLTQDMCCQLRGRTYLFLQVKT